MKKTNIIRKTIQLLLIMQFSLNAFAQQGSLNITKDEIIKKAWNAMFGNLKNDDIKSVYVEAYFHGRKVPNRTTIKRPNFFRNEVTSGVLVFDGNRAAWTKRAPDKDGKPLKPKMIDTASWRHFEVDIAILFPAFFDYPTEYKGVKKNKNKYAYELYVELPLGGYITYFVDINSFLVSRRLVSWDGDSENDTWENLIPNYLKTDGFLYPDGYSFMGKDGIEQAFFKNVRFNVILDDELFRISDELK